MINIKTSNLKLKDVLNYEELNKIFRHFAVTTELNVALYDIFGKEELSFRFNGKDCICCKVEKSCEKCRISICYGGEKSTEIGEPYIFKCGCGMIMCSSPVLFEEELIGSIVIGPVLLWEADDYALEELKANTADMQLNSEDLKTILKTTKQLSCVNMTSASQILFSLVNYMCRQESKFLIQRKKISEQQSKISELFAENKQNAVSLDVLNKNAILRKYSIEQEKELIAYVQLGDKNNAKKMLNAVLSEIFSYASGNLDTLRAKIYELTAFLFRAAVDVGAPIEEMTGIIKKSAQILSEETEFEELCFFTNEAMENFMDTVYKNRNRKLASQHLSRAISYIKQKYNEEINLEIVAKSSFVSSFYLSHLFREEMYTTFSDYVTKVRVEEAKILLKDKSKKIQEISDMVGFSDANYFIKMFKKLCGISPKQYQSICS